MICEKCGKEFFEDWRSDKRRPLRFCSRKCSNSRVFTEEAKQKKKEKSLLFSYGYVPKDEERTKKRKERVHKQKIVGTCKICGKEITKLKTGFCKECLNNSPEGKKYQRQINLQGRKEGKIQSWVTRNILSYPEKFWLQVLQNNNIICEKPNKYFRPYFLDFWLIKNNTNVDLEIDGKQHKYKDRIESDKKRDLFLEENNFKVYRVDWNEINTESGKNKMKEKINKFLLFYKSL